MVLKKVNLKYISQLKNPIIRYIICSLIYKGSIFATSKFILKIFIDPKVATERAQRYNINHFIENSLQHMKTFYMNSYGYCGLAWIVNCLLELGVRCDYNPCTTFKEEKRIDDKFSLYSLIENRSTNNLKFHLPNLNQNTEWKFLEEVFIQHIPHYILPAPDNNKYPTIFCIRDPRDSLYSDYIRKELSISFFDFVILNMPSWIQFMLSIAELQKVTFIRFEDTKLDPIASLKAVLEYIGVNSSLECIIKAVENSTFEKCRQNEQHITSLGHIKNEYAEKPIHQSGKIAKWKNIPEQKAAFDFVFYTAKPILERMGYIDTNGNYLY
ncbi:MAG: hypothetical protein K0S74_914 [Chlamydiales bacterium]|nr:hypothetical protein [Chlamydiales bacterium]